MKETKISTKQIDEKTEKEQETPTLIHISRKIRWIVFLILCCVSILMGVDQGILSSTTNEFKDSGMSEVQLGGLGGMIFLGTALGCIFSFIVINKINRKYLLLGTMTFDVLSLFFTTQTNNIVLLYLCRVVAGFTSAFVNVYLPPWTDQYGIHKHRSIMISLIHIASSLGYIFGYASGMYIGWKDSFFLQNILLIASILVIFILMPDKYFSMSLIPVKSKLDLHKLNESKEQKETTTNTNKSEEDQIIKDIKIDLKFDENKVEENRDNLIYIESQEKEEKEKEEENKKEEDEVSLFENELKEEDIRKEPIINHLKALIKSPIFILMNITLSSMFIIVSAIQFWINDYLEYGLLIEDKNVRISLFGFVVATAPAAGIILGGVLAGKVGGYDKEKAIYIPLFTSLGVVILANLCPIFTNLFLFLPLFWTLLFLGSVLLPVANGIVIVSVKQKYSGSASAVSILIYHILGRLPGPNLYAFLKSMVNDKNSRIPFWLLLNVSVAGFLAVLICVKFQKEKYRNLNNDKETKKILDEEEKKDDLIADSINNDDITKDSINNVDTNTEKEIEKDEFNIKEKVLIKEKEE
jgi:MFS family permease